MRVIYEPTGKAREYSPLAINHYHGCDHGCSYCFVPGLRRISREDYRRNEKWREGLYADLQHDLQGNEICDQVLLSFVGDPYSKTDERLQITTGVLNLLARFQVPTAILSKGGTRCLRDLERFQGMHVQGTPLKIGATITCTTPDDEAVWEPGAATYEDRLEALREIKSQGIRTWVSLEPVINPEASLKIIRDTLEFVDEYKLGRLNDYFQQIQSRIHWPEYLRQALEILRPAKKDVYVKEGLRAAAPGVLLMAWETNADSTALRRPSTQGALST